MPYLKWDGWRTQEKLSIDPPGLISRKWPYHHEWPIASLVVRPSHLRVECHNGVTASDIWKLGIMYEERQHDHPGSWGTLLRAW